MYSGIEKLAIGLACSGFFLYGGLSILGGVLVALLRAWSEENSRNGMCNNWDSDNVPPPAGVGSLDDLERHEGLAIAAEE